MKLTRSLGTNIWLAVWELLDSLECVSVLVSRKKVHLKYSLLLKLFYQQREKYSINIYEVSHLENIYFLGYTSEISTLFSSIVGKCPRLHYPFSFSYKRSLTIPNSLYSHVLLLKSESSHSFLTRSSRFTYSAAIQNPKLITNCYSQIHSFSLSFLSLWMTRIYPVEQW